VVRQEGTRSAATATSAPATTTRRRRRTYEDFGLLTADPDVGADLTDLFNVLTGYSRQTAFPPAAGGAARRSAVRHHRAHRAGDRAAPPPACPALVQIKTNALVDEEVIDALYLASRPASASTW
jgi:polyphosphate kinase